MIMIEFSLETMLFECREWKRERERDTGKFDYLTRMYTNTPLEDRCINGEKEKISNRSHLSRMVDSIIEHKQMVGHIDGCVSGYIVMKQWYYQQAATTTTRTQEKNCRHKK